MKLSSRQLAKLRELGRTSNELELRHQARVAATHTQRDYLQSLKRRLEELPRVQDAAMRDTRSVVEQEAVASKFGQSESELREEILTARGEFEQLQEQLSQITMVSAPLRDLIDRVLRSANLSRQAAGLAFGDDSRGMGEHISLRAG